MRPALLFVNREVEALLIGKDRDDGALKSEGRTTIILDNLFLLGKVAAGKRPRQNGGHAVNHVEGAAFLSACHRALLEFFAFHGFLPVVKAAISLSCLVSDDLTVRG